MGEKPTFNEDRKKDEETIMYEFEAFIKTCLRNALKNYKKEVSRRAKRYITFSDIPVDELNSFYVYDKYPSDYHTFKVLDFDIEIENELLVEALKLLPPRKRDILLLSYFMDMKDTEIAQMLNLVKSTVNYHKKQSLELLKNFIQGEEEK